MLFLLTKNKAKKGDMALGDDETELLETTKNKHLKNIHRIATLKKHGSLYHSILKLLSKKYRNSDVYTRIKMAKDISTKLDTDIESVATKINHGIMLLEGPYKISKFNKDADNWIMLHRTNDKEFEPLVYDDGENHHYVFNSDSDLLG